MQARNFRTEILTYLQIIHRNIDYSGKLSLTLLLTDLIGGSQIHEVQQLISIVF